jgi:hypothetical protein
LSLQALLEYIHAGFLFLTSGLNPINSHLWADQASNPFQAQDAVVAQVWFNFISTPFIFRTLFLLKLPYLIFDIACSILMFRLNDNPQRAFISYSLWWLNPILIFAIYIFGRHEVITLLFIVLSIYQFQKEKWNSSFLWLGISIALRYYAILLLPLFVLSLPVKLLDQLKKFLIGLLPWIIVNVFSLIFHGTVEVTQLANIQHTSYLLAGRIQLAAWDNLYLFVLFYIFIVIHRLYNPVRNYQTMIQYSFITMLLMFAVSYTAQSPQYWTWLLPWVIIVISNDWQLIFMHLLQALCLIVYSFIGGRATEGYLFGSIAPDFFWSLPSPLEIIRPFLSPEIVISLAHTAFTGVSLWMLYVVIQRKITFVKYQQHDNGDMQENDLIRVESKGT